ncbi:MAG: 4a-hydroxytetrahydrobiopterin dehydratase [Gemmatimonadetes bacterium]|nr:MAG: 4a-hydroxytetrahydrobiopterin dehydratase [Gemmatimonadota bacterium]
MMKLAEMHCEPTHADSKPLTPAEIEAYRDQIPQWNVTTVEGIDRIEREYTFKDFVTAISFANKVGEIAEAEDHHPALLIEWGKVKVTWWTHSIGGLHLNDLIMAAQSDVLYAG